MFGNGKINTILGTHVEMDGKLVQHPLPVADVQLQLTTGLTMRLVVILARA